MGKFSLCGNMILESLTGNLDKSSFHDMNDDACRGQETINMTLRGLYDYVLNCITNRSKSTKTDESQRVRERSLDLILLTSESKNVHHISELPKLSPIDRRIRTISSGIGQTSVEGTRLQSTIKEGEGETRERLGGYLHPRDMRRLVTPFSSSNEPELMVRRHVMLMNFDPLRAIVLRDRILVLVPDGADSILMQLEQRVRGKVEEEWQKDFDSDTSSLSHRLIHNIHDTNFDPIDSAHVALEFYSSSNPVDVEQGDRCLTPDSDAISPIDADVNKFEENDLSLGSTDEDTQYSLDDEWNDIDGRHFMELPFELRAVDALLSTVSSMLSEDASSLKQNIHAAIEEFLGSSSPGDHIQDQLRSLKDLISEMEGRVQGMVRALNQILDEDEDMALMNLSRLISHPERFLLPVSQDILNEESDEPELILEAYLQQALSEYNALVLLKGNIASTEGLVGVKLDAIRNRLLYINTLVTYLTLCVAFASLIGCLFGMNVPNPLRFHYDIAWWPLVYSSAIFTTCLFVLFIYILRWLGIRA